MSSFRPIQVGNSNRIPTLLNSTNSVAVLKKPASNVTVIQNTFGGPVLEYAIKGENNKKSISGNYNSVKNTIYNSPSGLTDYSFGPKQPFVIKKPGKSYSRLDDVVRISKFSVSGKGLMFYLKQFLLQRQAPYNETNIYNPLSPVASTVRGVSFGLLPRTKRHIDTGGGLLAGFLSAAGFSDNQTLPPNGTAAAKDSTTLPSEQVSNGKGNIRAKTGADARERALLKYGESTRDKKGGFLSNLGRSIISGLGFGKLPDQFKDVKIYTNDKYYRADQDFYWMMLNYHTRKIEGSLENHKLYGTINDSEVPVKYRYSIKNGPKTSEFPDIKPYTDSLDRTEQTKINSKIYQKYLDLSSGSLKSTKSLSLISPLQSGFVFKQSPSSEYYNPEAPSAGPVQVDSKTGINAAHVRKLKESDIILRKSKTGLTYDKIGQFMTDKKSVSIANMAGSGVSDAVNLSPIIEYSGEFLEKSVFESAKTPLDIDQILFYFHDIVNKRIIQFRSILTAISDNDMAEWDDISYLGRPDKIYNYKGYTRTLNFSFVVNINSVKELYPTWVKLNYVKSMTRPAKYVDELFMTPPIVKINIGDIYKGVPVAISSINMTIPDDAPWETLPDGEGEYLYSGDMVRIPNIKRGQYPTRVEISMTSNVIESNSSPKIGDKVFGQGSTKFDLSYKKQSIESRIVKSS